IPKEASKAALEARNSRIALLDALDPYLRPIEQRVEETAGRLQNIIKENSPKIAQLEVERLMLQGERERGEITPERRAEIERRIGEIRVEVDSLNARIENVYREMNTLQAEHDRILASPKEALESIAKELAEPARAAQEAQQGIQVAAASANAARRSALSEVVQTTNEVRRSAEMPGSRVSVDAVIRDATTVKSAADTYGQVQSPGLKMEDLPQRARTAVEQLPPGAKDALEKASGLREVVPKPEVPRPPAVEAPKPMSGAERAAEVAKLLKGAKSEDIRSSVDKAVRTVDEAKGLHQVDAKMLGEELQRLGRKVDQKKLDALVKDINDFLRISSEAGQRAGKPPRLDQAQADIAALLTDGTIIQAKTGFGKTAVFTPLKVMWDVMYGKGKHVNIQTDSNKRQTVTNSLADYFNRANVEAVKTGDIHELRLTDKDGRTRDLTDADLQAVRKAKVVTTDVSTLQSLMLTLLNPESPRAQKRIARDMLKELDKSSNLFDEIHRIADFNDMIITVRQQKLSEAAPNKASAAMGVLKALNEMGFKAGNEFGARNTELIERMMKTNGEKASELRKDAETLRRAGKEAEARQVEQAAAQLELNKDRLFNEFKETALQDIATRLDTTPDALRKVADKISRNEKLTAEEEALAPMVELLSTLKDILPSENIRKGYEIIETEGLREVRPIQERAAGQKGLSFGDANRQVLYEVLAKGDMVPAELSRDIGNLLVTTESMRVGIKDVMRVLGKVTSLTATQKPVQEALRGSSGLTTVLSEAGILRWYGGEAVRSAINRVTGEKPGIFGFDLAQAGTAKPPVAGENLEGKVRQVEGPEGIKFYQAEPGREYAGIEAYIYAAGGETKGYSGTVERARKAFEASPKNEGDFLLYREPSVEHGEYILLEYRNGRIVESRNVQPGNVLMEKGIAGERGTALTNEIEGLDLKTTQSKEAEGKAKPGFEKTRFKVVVDRETTLTNLDQALGRKRNAVDEIEVISVDKKIGTANELLESAVRREADAIKEFTEKSDIQDMDQVVRNGFFRAIDAEMSRADRGEITEAVANENIRQLQKGLMEFDRAMTKSPPSLDSAFGKLTTERLASELERRANYVKGIKDSFASPEARRIFNDIADYDARPLELGRRPTGEVKPFLEAQNFRELRDSIEQTRTRDSYKEFSSGETEIRNAVKATEAVEQTLSQLLPKQAEAAKAEFADLRGKAIEKSGKAAAELTPAEIVRNVKPADLKRFAEAARVMLDSARIERNDLIRQYTVEGEVLPEGERMIAGQERFIKELEGMLKAAEDLMARPAEAAPPAASSGSQSTPGRWGRCSAAARTGRGGSRSSP
ncbi:MAG: hypothetical protein QXF14_02390, partial [Candidatus Woesearchaeota archaeon]